MITPRVKLETQSFTYVSRNTGKEELVNLNENQLNSLREFYVERFVDNMETEDLVQYVTDDMFDEIIEDVKEFEQCDFKKTIDDKREDYLDSLSEGKDFDNDYGSKVDALVDSMSVTDEKESTVHRRKDLDSL